MNKDKRNNIQLLGTLNNADESGIIANANQVYDANEDKSTQDVSKEHKERIETLETKESSMQTTLENIIKTGEASAASNVTYNHNDSQLDASNVQQAIDELKIKKFDKDNNENIEFAKNGTGVTVPKGKVVYINSSTGENPIFQLATNADYAIASRAWGITMDSIDNNAVGKIIHFGMIENIDTSAYTEGTELWLGVNGEFTNVRPTSPAFQTSIGMVIRQSATVGSIFVNIRFLLDNIRTYDAGVIPTIENGTDNDYKQAAINLVPESLHVGGMTVLYSKQGDTAKQSIFLPLSSWSSDVNKWESIPLIKENYGSSDLEISDNNGYALVKLKDGHIITKNFNSSEAALKEEIIPIDTSKFPLVENAYNAEFSIGDENGSNIAIFSDGHFRTKKFDSRRFTLEDNEDSDLELSDTKGNAIVKIRKGHIITKNFDSEKDVPKKTSQLINDSNFLSGNLELLKMQCLLFDKVIFFGDSVTHGYTTDDNNVITNDDVFSYPTRLGQVFTSWNVTNKGWSGQTPKGWWNNWDSQSMTDNFMNSELCLFELGWNGGVTNTLDTDVKPYVNSPYSSEFKYKDTSCGYYCMLIEKIIETNPNIFLVLVCSQAMKATNNETYLAINNIAEYYNIPIINDMDVYPNYADGDGSVHSTASGYALKAAIMLREIGSTIYNNKDKANVCAYYNHNYSTLFGTCKTANKELVFTDDFGNTFKTTASSTANASGTYDFKISLHYGNYNIDGYDYKVVLDKVKKININI